MYYEFICNLGLCALTPDVHLNLVCNFDSKFNSFKTVLMHKMNKTMAQKWVTLQVQLKSRKGLRELVQD